MTGTRFAPPPGSDATEPPESRGVARDQVRLLVARPDGVRHARFADLADQLRPGDLVVVNTSATLPAALDVTLPDGSSRVLHVAGPAGDGTWVVELRRPDGSGPDPAARAGLRLELPGGVRLELCASYPVAGADASRLWRAAGPTPPLHPYLAAHGRPVTYGYLSRPRPLADYQTVYAAEPGSAEMASAGRPFSAALLIRLMARGIPVVPVVLHAGLSSPELHEPPTPERFAVPEVTARLVTGTRAAGGRIVAVGTTVVRALESATDHTGTTRAARGWTDLVLGPDRPARVVTGLVSGLHDPQASHLRLLDAVAGADLVDAAYRAAVADRYLWHEFGDSTLLLPALSDPRAVRGCTPSAALPVPEGNGSAASGGVS
ncbi:MAG TPA: S-adenosylmethionine:tRNA ribosyltransferase-isomerase [Catenuloplanes sp.]|jgi:S-adenosylmethionine:tRNA ribosyltransferase-isomerase